MDKQAIDALRDAAELVILARERLDPHIPSKTRLLLDMLLLDLGEQLAKLTGDPLH